MVIRITTYIVQIIVFSRNSQTFLSISNSRCFWFFVTKEIVLKLCHSRVGKHQSWIVFQNDGSRRNDKVFFAFKNLKTVGRISCEVIFLLSIYVFCKKRKFNDFEHDVKKKTLKFNLNVSKIYFSKSKLHHSSRCCLF